MTEQTNEARDAFAFSADTEQLEMRIGHRFLDHRLLREALTHSTYAHEMRQKRRDIPYSCNERLEFLGDAVLSLIIGDYLYRSYPDSAEGELTNLRKYLVCREALAAYSTELDLGRYLYLGRGEEKLGGRTSPSILENAFEALTAAVYLDEENDGRDGRAAVKAYFLPLAKARLAQYGRLETIQDYKTLLQEIVQRAKEDTLTYVTVSESGPDHCKTFTVEARLNASITIGTGSGRTKREAEQAAAKQAITDYFRDFAES
ncbi:MAG: ribonuclease III [Clostridia bacterium]|nr:ribonuclease III [Clostridia bacterium]